MRTRKDIQENLQEQLWKAGSVATTSTAITLGVLLEVLLDIRDLLHKRLPADL